MKTIILLLLTTQCIFAQTFSGNFTPLQKQIVLTELSKYPKKLIDENLKKIVFEDMLSNDPTAAGRSHGFSGEIELSNRFSNEVLKSTIHHELSSVLIIRYDVFVKTGFADSVINLLYHLNKEKYNISYSKNVRKLSDEDLDYYLFSTYAKTCAENDLNSICESLFTDGERVIELSKLNKPISKKIRIILNVYRTYDPIFTYEYFQKMK